jgi:signal transduction histidine kinase
MLMPAERIDEEAGILRRIRGGESISHYETVRRHKDGGLLDISLSVSPIHDAGGRIIGASKIARFIGDRKRMEGALRESDRRKDEFLAMLSHELRNPLATIRNSVELLRMDPGDAMQRKVLGPLERQVSTLSRLVDDLMDVSRVTMGRVCLKRSDVAMERIVREAADSVRKEMRDRKHTFTVPAVDPHLKVNVDAVRLEQVVVNLLINAAKYTPDGGIISLSVAQEGEDAGGHDAGPRPGWTGDWPRPGEVSGRDARGHCGCAKRRSRQGQRVYRAPAGCRIERAFERRGRAVRNRSCCRQ